MRLVPRHWHTETWVCSMRGHIAPAASVARLRPEDHRVGIEVDDGRRLARCLRCDMWLEVLDPPLGEATSDTLPPVADLPKPRRGKVLQDAVLLRVIALERAVHCIVFGLLALVLAALELKLPGLQTSARDLDRRLSSNAVGAGQAASRTQLNSWLHRVIGLHKSALTVLLATAMVYCVVEGIEAVGLWRERRWAEYLTVLATVGFLPFEIRELAEKVTVIRIGALVLNLAVLAWLVWSKHLFGLRGGPETINQDTDWDAILAHPSPAALNGR